MPALILKAPVPALMMVNPMVSKWILGQPQGVLLGQPKNGQPQGGAHTMSLPMNILAVLNNRVGRAFPVIYGNAIIMNLETTSILTQGIKS